jgi:adenylate cyclase, class 2
MMAYEVEAKAPCPGANGKVKALGARFLKTQKQEDTYYRHPARDFKKTDEALRLRRADGLCVTYKGPKRKSDLKVREELEFPVPEEMARLLELLGFKEAFTVRKTRSTYSLEGLTICCDLVEGLGEYVEVESFDEGDREKIMGVLERLGIRGEATTKSYSELLGL